MTQCDCEIRVYKGKQIGNKNKPQKETYYTTGSNPCVMVVMYVMVVMDVMSIIVVMSVMAVMNVMVVMSVMVVMDVFPAVMLG